MAGGAGGGGDLWPRPCPSFPHSFSHIALHTATSPEEEGGKCAAHWGGGDFVQDILTPTYISTGFIDSQSIEPLGPDSPKLWRALST